MYGIQSSLSWWKLFCSWSHIFSFNILLSLAAAVFIQAYVIYVIYAASVYLQTSKPLAPSPHLWYTSDTRLLYLSQLGFHNSQLLCLQRFHNSLVFVFTPKFSHTAVLLTSYAGFTGSRSQNVSTIKSSLENSQNPSSIKSLLPSQLAHYSTTLFQFFLPSLLFFVHPALLIS